jgi:hypothetical protein
MQLGHGCLLLLLAVVPVCAFVGQAGFGLPKTLPAATRSATRECNFGITKLCAGGYETSIAKLLLKARYHKVCRCLVVHGSIACQRAYPHALFTVGGLQVEATNCWTAASYIRVPKAKAGGMRAPLRCQWCYRLMRSTASGSCIITAETATPGTKVIARTAV